MEWLLEEPGVVLVFVTLAAVLLVVEVALPTLGVAGALGFGAAVAAVVAVANDEMTWWPLIGPAAAVTVWAVVIAARVASPAPQMAALGSFAAGGIGFGLANEDVASVVITLLATAGLAVGFPRAQRAANRLLDRPSVVGMDGLVGKQATVDRWSSDAHVVMLDGSRWNAVADGPVALGVGDPVRVVGYHGNTVEVEDVRPAVHRPQRRSRSSRSTSAASSSGSGARRARRVLECSS